MQSRFGSYGIAMEGTGGLEGKSQLWDLPCLRMRPYNIIPILVTVP